MAKNKKSEHSKSLEVNISSPFDVYYKGKALSVSAVNKTGDFDILPGHANFITILASGEIKVRYKDKKTSFKISGGIMHVYENNVDIFADV